MKMITRYINWRSPSAPAGSLCCLGRQQSPKWTSNGLYASLTSFKDIIKFSLVQCKLSPFHVHAPTPEEHDVQK
ncbi:hypothetical protein BT69DRAFT_795928 [Atractiella rhizophila]|nr:hypothetical protein BT69DRAFT_795928 [Atractiella rhizophila]